MFDLTAVQSALQAAKRDGIASVPVPCHGRDYMLTITVPPLGMVAFKRKE